MTDTAGEPLVAVCGAHLQGQPLHPVLLALGARYVSTLRTAPVYRMVALPPTSAGDGAAVPPRPGLIRTREGGGAVEVELYRMPVAGLGALVVTVQPPLAVGSVLLADGRQTPGFVCEGYAAETAPDITRFGGWRDFLRMSPA